MKKYITRTIWILSLVSLLTDVASEMLYPVMPIYLKSIGTMLASSITGLIWFQFGFATAFITTAVVTTVVIIYFNIAIPTPSD